jgi:acyl carrier protein
MPEISDSFEGALARTEQQVLEIWSDVLHLRKPFEENWIHTTFFDLGGDSLAAMLCVSRIRDAFGVAFTFEDLLLGDATVITLASKIDECLADDAATAGDEQSPLTRLEPDAG